EPLSQLFPYSAQFRAYVDVGERKLFFRKVDAPRTLAADLDGEPDAGGIVRRVARHVERGIGIRYLPGGADGRLTDRTLAARGLEAEVARCREIERRVVGQRRERRCGLRRLRRNDGRGAAGQSRDQEATRDRWSTHKSSRLVRTAVGNPVMRIGVARDAEVERRQA